MGRTEARILLVVITLFASVQYAFIEMIGDEDYSPFGFTCLTNLIGLGMVLVMFGGMIFGEFYRYTKKDILNSLLLAVELTGFNVFMYIGSSSETATVSGGILSAYFVFVPIIMFVFRLSKPKPHIIVASLIAVVGVFIVVGIDMTGTLRLETLALVVADICFALYTVTVGRISMNSSPTFIAAGQLFWCSVMTGILWIGEVVLTDRSFSISTNPMFIVSVGFMGVFLKGLYTVAQIHAQRIISPIETSFIFSTEILMTMFLSPLLALLLPIEKETITPIRLLGGVLVIIGIMVADDNTYSKLSKKFRRVDGGKKT